MTREQAINYLISSGFTHEQVGEVVRALTYEPTTKNDPKFCPDRKAKTTNMETILHCIENECAAYKDGKCLKYNSDQEPTTKNDLGVDEVTALAEWTTKLTKECEEAYKKGYEAGRKELEPITSKDKFIYALTACGCLLKDGKTWYEHNELIKCFENLGLFEQEPTIKALGEELRKARKGIADEKVLIGYNMAVAICNKHLGESEG